MMGLACSILALTAFFVTLCLSAMAAWSDLKRMKIENSIPIVITICFVVVFTLDLAYFKDVDVFGAWWSGPLAGLLMFVLTFIMFAGGMIGGGDSKLASALSLWVGLKGLPAFIFYMSITGGVLAAIAVYNKKRPLPEKLTAKLGEESWFAVLKQGKSALPYGIAIFIGSGAAFLYIGLVQKLFSLPALVFVAHS